MNAARRAGIRRLIAKASTAKYRLYEVQTAILIGLSPSERGPAAQKVEEALTAIGRLQDALEALVS